jgi:FemAB-related protein (PEP-CTERM system-associated)
VQIRALAPGDEPRWDAYAADHSGATVYHGAAWAGLIRSLFGHETHHLLAEDQGGHVRGVLPLVRLRSRLFGDYLVSVPYVNYGGVVADTPAIAEELLDEACRLADRLGVSHLELRHSAPLAADWPVRTDKVAMVLELPTTSSALWQALGSKLRSQVKRPQKEGATLERGGAELVPAFYRVFAENMRDLGTPVYPLAFFQAIARTFPDRVEVVVVRVKGEAAAAGFLLANGRTLEIPWASSLRRHNPIGANMLLYWAALEGAVEKGFAAFDFGRSTREGGTYRFKRQWGAKERPLYWHYWLRPGVALPRLNPDNPKYALAIKAWQRLPLALANTLGPRLVKNLP